MLFNEILENIQTVSDDHPYIERATCPCGGKELGGICDGRGNVFVDSGAYICPVMEEKYLSSHIGIASHFSDWPPKPFADTWNNEEDEITDPFLYSEKMMHDIHAGNHPWSVIYFGGPGRSKTYSALQICRGCYKIRKRFFAIKFNDIIESYKRGINGDETRIRIFNRIKFSDFILIDDIGKQRSGGRDYTVEVLWNIVELTFRRAFMIWTTNLSKIDFINNLKSSKEDDVTPLLSRISYKSGWFVRGIEEPFDQDLRMKI